VAVVQTRTGSSWRCRRPFVLARYILHGGLIF
jgi:hypothetical protein